MKRDELGDLQAFLSVAEVQSFTKAAAQMGTSQSSLSHVIRRLEERLNVKLLNRSTRSVTLTDAGKMLQSSLRPAFDNIENTLESLQHLQGRAAGNIRITTSRSAAEYILLPVVTKLLTQYQDIKIEINVDQRFVDIVKEGFDAGIRLNEHVDKDMVAIPVGPPLSMCAAATKEYFKHNGKPTTPQELIKHNCINIRLPTLGGLYAWEFEKDGSPINVRVSGQFICNDASLALSAALKSQGIVFLPRDYVQPHLDDGELEQVLEDWCPSFPGFYLFYPSRHQISPAFRLLIDALIENRERKL